MPAPGRVDPGRRRAVARAGHDGAAPSVHGDGDTDPRGQGTVQAVPAAERDPAAGDRGRSTPWTASTSPSSPARRSDWWARAARASPPWPASSPGSSSRRPAAWCSTAPTSRPCAGPSSAGNARRMQMVFQDPYSSLDPRQNILEIVGEPLEIHTSLTAAQRRQRVIELLGQVGHRAPRARTPAPRVLRWPAPAPGHRPGARPRARACSCATSRSRALDVSTQSQVINLLSDLQDRLGLAYLFIAHDLSVVRHLSDRIAVMYLGQDRRGGRRQRGLSPPDPSLHGGIALGHPGAGPPS